MFNGSLNFLKRKNEIIALYISDYILELMIFTKDNDFLLEKTKRYEVTSYEHCFELLEKIFSDLTPSRDRIIVASIPQREIFYREISLKNLSLDEAINSIRLSVSNLIHIDIEDAIYDFALREENGNINVLIQYANKKLIDNIINVFTKTKHIKSLYCISSIFYGLNQILKKYNFSLPCIVQTDNTYDQSSKIKKKYISLHNKTEWNGLHIINLDESIEEILDYYPLFKDSKRLSINITHDVDFNIGQKAIDIINDILNKQRPVNPAFLTLGLSFIKPQLSFYPKYKKTLTKPQQLAYNLLVFTILIVLSIITFYDLITYFKNRNQITELKTRLKKIESSVKPLIEMQNQYHDLKKEVDEIQEFINEKISILEILKVLTLSTPDHSFLRTFYFTDNKLRISVSGKSAIELIDTWRKITYFQDVKLISTVSKEREDLETFTVEITLKTKENNTTNQQQNVETLY